MPSMTEDETVKLDKLKGERSQLRRVFTNAARRFSDVLESTDIQTKDISSDFNKVIEKAERLFKVDEEIKAVTFEYTDEEFDIIESYRDKLTEIKSKYSKHLQEDFKHPEDDVRSTSSKVDSSRSRVCLTFSSSEEQMRERSLSPTPWLSSSQRGLTVGCCSNWNTSLCFLNVLLLLPEA
ncbi:hypothetical protein JTE90_018569 [Oedothorax gibbosus]|uniref:Uncharacterized protein n=1 Tax=Oedothorax gibbosus TaxID=931172 RepID=A0AAV6U3Q7_9ARAC|nr:hypothetical protein JTE90_018569 [Oedothorax gibbosus]